MTSLRKLPELTLSHDGMSEHIDITLGEQCVSISRAEFVELRSNGACLAKINSVARMLEKIVMRSWRLTPERYRR